MLTDLIAKYHKAQRAWQEKSAVHDNDDNTQAEWNAYEDAEDQVFGYPCQTIEDVRLKAQFALDNENAIDTLASCYRTVAGKKVPSVVFFLRSLLGEATAPVDCGDN